MKNHRAISRMDFSTAPAGVEEQAFRPRPVAPAMKLDLSRVQTDIGETTALLDGCGPEVRVAEVEGRPRTGSDTAAPDFVLSLVSDSSQLEYRSLGPARSTPQPKKLGEWHATALAGNDITSSCLYASGIISHAAGAPTAYPCSSLAWT